MSNDDIIREVKDAIGPASDQDVLIDPEGHRQLLEDKSPSIASILDSASIRASAKQQQLAATPARQTQSTFKRQSNRAASLVVIAATSSAAIMVTGMVLSEASSSRQVLSVVLAVVGLAAATGAATLMRIIQGSKLLEKWMESRATAETKRLEYFEKITSAQPRETSDPLRTRLVQLEYFRRYQLDGQLRYYESACNRHERVGNRLVVQSAIAIGLAGFVNAAAGILGAWHPELAAIAALGIVAQAMGSKLTNDEAISQDSRNAERYRRTRDALIGLHGRLDRVRESIADGNGQTLAAFVEAVHEQLSLEHRQWIESRNEVDAAMRRLQKQIDTSKESFTGDHDVSPAT